jgi:hypothetical protein
MAKHPLDDLDALTLRNQLAARVPQLMRRVAGRGCRRLTEVPRHKWPQSAGIVAVPLADAPCNCLI